MRRRHFFRSFLAATASAVEQVKGRPQLALGELDQLPDAVLGLMRPVRQSLGPYRVEHASLVRTIADGGERRPVHTFEPWELDVLDRFDGRSTLHDIARAHGAVHGVDADAAWCGAKSLFIALCSYLVCHPSGPPESAASTSHVPQT
jgi:hypothetical protein